MIMDVSLVGAENRLTYDETKASQPRPRSPLTSTARSKLTATNLTEAERTVLHKTFGGRLSER